MPEETTKPVRLTKSGKPDKRYSNGENLTARMRGKNWGNQVVPKIDYGDETGVTPMLQAFRYVANHGTPAAGEDSVMRAARRMRKKAPMAFLEKLDQLEKDWQARRPTKPGTDIPLEMDTKSEKCLEAIETYLKRLRSEALGDAEKEREALRGARSVG